MCRLLTIDQPRWVERRSSYTKGHPTEPTEPPAQIVKTFSKETVDGWRKEMGTLLVYAGLFSAVLTAYIVKS
ncbi:hypothetical protein C8Q80DRAFT_1108159 [Daedaleopsis nitida]|nr:hypothetical protein C8Q80DRAFT_1108159 [Daedaleopsis nitida]